MRKLVLTTLGILLSTTAFAADMPVKARPYNPLVFPYNGSGFFWGVAMKGGVEQNSANGSFLGTSLVAGSVNALGGGVGGTLGWMHGMQDKWIAVEATGYYQNITGASTAVGATAATSVTMASRWSAEQVIKVGGWNPFSWLGNLGGFQFPTLPQPPVPTNIALAPNSHPYIMAGVEEFGIEGQFFTATGTTMGVAPLVGAGIMNQILDSKGALTGAVLDTGAQVVFADKGLQVNGLFATPGGMAPTFGSLNMGKKYEVFLKVDF